MAFWIVAAALVALAAGVILRPALRAAPAAGREAPSDLTVYRDQLAEIDRDLARGTLAPDEAERTRTEVARRILEADRARGGAAAETGARGPVAPLALGAAVLAAAVGVYLWLGAPGYPDLPHGDRIARAEEMKAKRPSQAEAEAAQPARPLADPEEPELRRLIAALRAAVADRPDDLTGQELLARNEAALGNRGAAAAAQARVVALKGDQATAGDYAMLADTMVLAAGGVITPEAEAALNAALARDPGNGTARFYLGLLDAQTGRPDRAFVLWRDLLESSPPGAPWVPAIRERIGLLADAAGVEYTPPGAGTAGPGAADVAAAGDMAPEDREAMIRGMVEGLASRLANDGGTGAEWAQLITALGVLGETERARGIWAEAQDVFAASPSDLETVAAAARQAGVAE